MEVKNRNPYIYIICGKARHGKDTIASILKKIYEEKNKQILNLSYGSYIKEYAKKISAWDGSEETKPRELLQKLGTDIIRKNIDELFFVKRIIDDIKVYSYFFDVLTISDGRFKTEVINPKAAFKNVIVIHVDRPNFDNGLTEEQKRHPSEVDLDDYDGYDFYVSNDGTIDDLEKKIRDLVSEVESHGR